MKVELNAKEFDMVLAGLESFILKIRNFQLENHIDRSYDLKCFLELHEKMLYYSHEHMDNVGYENFLNEINGNE